jgi:hypothetical protein
MCGQARTSLILGRREAKSRSAASRHLRGAPSGREQGPLLRECRLRARFGCEPCRCSASAGDWAGEPMHLGSPRDDAGWVRMGSARFMRVGMQACPYI